MSTCVARLLECDAATFALRRVGVSTVDRTFDDINVADNLKPDLITLWCTRGKLVVREW
jgi:hypothetical protein